MCEIIEIDTTQLNIQNLCDDIYQNRAQLSFINNKKFNSEVTVFIQAYNNIEKTKRCIESVLKYTQGIDYDLILVDNGSSDGTFEYFKEIVFHKKTVIRFNKNCGVFLPQLYIGYEYYSKYIVFLANDLIVTSNWLSNLIRIAESDPKIGMINPVSSNVSNCQGINFNFRDYDEMQTIAANYNISNPSKWHERLRLITLGTFYRKECLYTIGFPVADIGFVHNFGDDDTTFRVRRSGYKAILAKDTWIHHDDSKTDLCLEQALKINKDLEIGRENFNNKYFGIDAWTDVNNYIFEYVEKVTPVAATDNRILGIDVRCGTPILEIKNQLRSFDIFDAECFAYTTDGRYFIDLQTICGANNVFSGGIDSFQRYFDAETIDHIVIGNDINTYANPFMIIKSAFNLLKNSGQLFFSVQNTMNIFAFLYSIGNTNTHNPVHALNYSAEEFLSKLIQLGYKAEFLSAGFFAPSIISNELSNSVETMLKKLPVKVINETMFRLKAERFFYMITKQ